MTDMKTTITGASDDLIEVDGAITSEFYATAPDGKDNVLCFSDGTTLAVRYDEDGIWRVELLVKGACEFSIVKGDVDADTFDVATLTGVLQWCRLN